MAKENSKNFWLLIGFIVFVPLNYAVWLNWSENVDRRLKNLESKIDAEHVIAHEENKIDTEQHAISYAAPERYLCVADNAAYFTQIPNQKDCRADKLPDGWKNLLFSREQLFDYYYRGLSHHGTEVKVWSRMLFNSPKINATPQSSGTQNKIEFDELRSLLVFNCSSRDYKNPNVIYLLKGEELLRTTGNRTVISSNGLRSDYYDDIFEQIVPGTFVDALYKEVCNKPEYSSQAK